MTNHKEPQKITTEIILADFIPAPARTPELAREITAAIRADNQAALEGIIQRTHQAFAIQQKQIDIQQMELSRIQQEIKRLKRQPQIIYNISDNRSINIQTTSNSWNTYNQSTYNQSNHSQNYTHNTYETPWNTYTPSIQSRTNDSQTDYIGDTYETSWNAYNQSDHRQQTQNHNYNQPDHRQRNPYKEEDSAANSFNFLPSWWPLPLILFISWAAWTCENQQASQTPQQIQRAR